MEGKELDKPNNIVAVSLEQRRMRACGPMKRRMPAIVTVIACRNDLEIISEIIFTVQISGLGCRWKLPPVRWKLPPTSGNFRRQPKRETCTYHWGNVRGLPSSALELKGTK